MDEQDAKHWPFFVLICDGCEQIGCIRTRRLRDAKSFAIECSRSEISADLSCIVFGQEGREVARYRKGKLAPKNLGGR